MVQPAGWLMQVGHWDATKGALTEETLRRMLMSMGYSVARYDYPPGTWFGPHRHAQDKIDAVLGGEFRITMGKESVVLRAGDWVVVPAGVEHEAEVVGQQTVASLDAVRIR